MFHHLPLVLVLKYHHHHHLMVYLVYLICLLTLLKILLLNLSKPSFFLVQLRMLLLRHLSSSFLIQVHNDNIIYLISKFRICNVVLTNHRISSLISIQIIKFSELIRSKFANHKYDACTCVTYTLYTDLCLYTLVIHRVLYSNVPKV